MSRRVRQAIGMRRGSLGAAASAPPSGAQASAARTAMGLFGGAVFGFVPVFPVIAAWRLGGSGVSGGALVLAALRLGVGSVLGGAAAGALVGRLLPATRDRWAAGAIGFTAAELCLGTIALFGAGLGDPASAGIVAAIIITGVIGIGIGFFARAVLLQAEHVPESPSALAGFVWSLAAGLNAQRPRHLSRRREKLRAQVFPPAWREILRRNMPWYSRLGSEDQRELERQILVFLAEKNFEGCGGLELTDEMRVTIAGEACLLTLHLDADYYPKLRSILVYPDTYVPARASLRPAWQDEPDSTARLGESWTTGAVVLSWNDVRASAINPEDGQNLVFHEFAHQLDQADGAGDGMPPQRSLAACRTWARVLQADYEHHRRAVERGQDDVLDRYGATNPAEFFAVATECFFEKSRALRTRHPELYAVLRAYYGQDPAAPAPVPTAGN